MPEEQERHYPISVTGKFQTHGLHTLESAYRDFVLGDQSHNYHVTIPLELSVEAELIDTAQGELLVLSMAGRKGTAPRPTANRPFEWTPKFGISTDYSKDWLDLNIHALEWEDPAFDRGLTWVHLADPIQATQSWRITRNHGLSLEELLERSQRAQIVACKLLDDILNNKMDSPNSPS